MSNLSDDASNDSALPAGVPPLVEALKQVPDFRSKHGKRYQLESVLALGIVATLCGYNSYGAMAEWGKNYGRQLAQALGFTKGKTPAVGTLFSVFSQVDKQALEAVLSAWNEQVLVALGQKAPHPIAALSVDGKSLRGTRKQQALDAHLLSAVSHQLGLWLHQEAVTDKENEIVALNRLLGDLLLKGRVLTMDALLTQKQIARQIVLKGGTL